MNVRLHHPTGLTKGIFALPASKSESNRALIIQALSQGRCEVKNLSDAEDTRTMIRLLESSDETLDVGHAGTVMRFLTAFLAFRPQDKILTGSKRMLERPIGILVDALRQMGADIQYLDREGYPPLAIYGKNARWGEDTIEIPGDVSSQFISALLLVAPTLPDGLRLTITGPCGSWPYIEMTRALMKTFGVESTRNGNHIEVPKQLYQGGPYAVENDWSAASYAFVVAGLAPQSDIFLPGLRPDSIQGDRQVVQMTEALGMRTRWEEAGLRVWFEKNSLPQEVKWNFRDCPDLAQGMMVLLAGLGVKGILSGLESLRIKETDRIIAMQRELSKRGVELRETQVGIWALTGSLQPSKLPIETYGDHRMAMAFAPIAVREQGLVVQDAEVVAKSFHGFWDSLDVVGFRKEIL